MFILFTIHILIVFSILIFEIVMIYSTIFSWLVKVIIAHIITVIINKSETSNHNYFSVPT